MSSIFNSISDKVLETSEQILKTLEEAQEILFRDDSMLSESNEGGGNGGSDSDGWGGSFTNQEDFEMGSDQGHFDTPSPLEGIANNVMGDIMKSQVRARKD